MYGYLFSLKSNKETHVPCTLSEFHRNSGTSDALHVPRPDGCPRLHEEVLTLLNFVLIIPCFS